MSIFLVFGTSFLHYNNSYYRKELDSLKRENEELRKDYEMYKNLAELREKSLEENQRLYLELKSATDQERNDNNVRCLFSLKKIIVLCLRLSKLIWSRYRPR